MNIWYQLQEYLLKGINVCLLTVIESRGSAPGRLGFKMLVAESGELSGSIGGGLMEYNLVELARQKLQQKTHQAFIKRQTHNKKSKNSSGMICSGSQVIGFNFFDQKDLLEVQHINQDSIIELSNQGFKRVQSTQVGGLILTDEQWYYREAFSEKTKLHLFGAGHVSVPCSELFKNLGFDVYLYDNRKNLNTYENNSFVSKKQVVDYQDVLSSASIQPADYVVLMTHKCAEDMMILSQLLDIQVGCYIGVLGSDNKIKVMFNQLIKSGCCPDLLKQVSAPIGLAINSQTPEEIAVSIAAELIKHKNSYKNSLIENF